MGVTEAQNYLKTIFMLLFAGLSAIYLIIFLVKVIYSTFGNNAERFLGIRVTTWEKLESYMPSIIGIACSLMMFSFQEPFLVLISFIIFSYSVFTIIKIWTGDESERDIWG